jgi:hypothetical protein
MIDIVVETEPDSGLLAKLPNATLLTPKHFGGGPELVNILVSLTAATLPLIAKVIIEQIRARKHVRVVLKGGKYGANLDIQGISDKEATEIVECYLRNIMQTATKKK